MRGPRLVICLAGFFLGDAVARNGDSIRCSFEWIEVSLEDIDGLLAKRESTLPGGPLRDELDQWIAEGRAAVVRTAMVAAFGEGESAVFADRWAARFTHVREAEATPGPNSPCQRRSPLLALSDA